LEIISDIEADKAGTSEERHISMTEQYKIGLIYMTMLENPEKFSHLDTILKV